jgi:hypothetical protein
VISNIDTTSPKQIIAEIKAVRISLLHNWNLNTRIINSAAEMQSAGNIGTR